MSVRLSPNPATVLAHNENLKRALAAFGEANAGVASAAGGAVNALLVFADQSMATAGAGAELAALHGQRLEAWGAVGSACATAQARFSALASCYRDVAATAASVNSSLLRPAHTAVEAGPSEAAADALRAGWERTRLRTEELLAELVERHGAQLALAAAVVARLRPAGDGSMPTTGLGGQHRPSFALGPGLPPWAVHDREHLMGLACALSLPTYADARRVDQLRDGVTHILTSLYSSPR
jgi:hypothetical protein